MKKILFLAVVLFTTGVALQAQQNSIPKQGGKVAGDYTPGNKPAVDNNVSRAEALSSVSDPVTVTGNAKLYGTTYDGGTYDRGTIFSYDPAIPKHTILYHFKDVNGNSPFGRFPHGGLVQGNDGKLYGTTYTGGTYDFGTLFSFNPANSVYKVVHHFSNTNGINPMASLIKAKDGRLFGTTSYGGTNNGGTLFSFDPATSSFATHHHFDNTNGGNPQSSVFEASNGILYGTATNGGSSDAGTIFSFDPDPLSPAYTVLLNFNGANGAKPYGGLMQAKDGKLYGTTSEGGSRSLGTLFSFDPASGIHTVLTHFSFTRGGNPYGGLIQAGNGKLYGMANMGGSGMYGTLFSFDPTAPLASAYSVVVPFNYTNGGNPNGTLMQAGNGKLYGTTYSGGTGIYGTLFTFDPVTSAHEVFVNFDKTNGSSFYYNHLTEAIVIPSSLTVYYRDSDGDGFGDPGNTEEALSPSDGFVEDNSDCDDTKLLYEDRDGDGYGTGDPVACGAENKNDNCPLLFNRDQKDGDRDGTGDLCDAVFNINSAIIALKEDVKKLVVLSGKKGLLDKLEAALAGCAKGNDKSTEKELKAFIKQVNGKQGKDFTDAQADALIGHANAIINALKEGTATCSSTPVATATQKANVTDAIAEKAVSLTLVALPNPSAHYFTLLLKGGSDRSVQIKVTDILGRTVEVKSFGANGAVKIGEKYKPGVYLVEAIQGKERVTLKLIKGTQ